MPSGLKIRSARNVPQGLPDAFLDDHPEQVVAGVAVGELLAGRTAAALLHQRQDLVG
jgi:hypothetical protein